jgi:DNA-binding MarR family transcriptional regulator
MARTLKEQIGKHSEFASAQEEAMLNVYRTASHLSGPEHAFFKKHKLSPASYNLLRILRGHSTTRLGDDQIGGVRASEIGCKMVVRMPDVTRLVDRLEGMDLVSRSVATDDKRVKIVKITRKGLKLLSKLDDQVNQLVMDQLGHMSRSQLSELSRLLELARNEDGSAKAADERAV